MFKAFRSLPLWLACAMPLQAAPVAYTIVGKVSRVSFSFEHQGFIQLFGTLRLAPGQFVFDADEWRTSSVQVRMPVRSLDMGDALWNRQIRGDDAWGALFKTSSIDFKSTRIERINAQRGVLHGDLTLAGRTRPVELQLQLNKLGPNRITQQASVGLSAQGTIRRSDFGLGAYADLVGDEIKVQIQIEGVVGDEVEPLKDLDALGLKG